MMWLLFGLARAACDVNAAAASIQAAGDRDTYLCLAEEEAGKDAIVEQLLSSTGGEERLTRALALWLLTRTDRAMDPDLLEELSGSDRRLLADGIRARRGRRSPSAEHDTIFQQFSWYSPIATYTDGRLRPIDRANIAAVNAPPKPKAAPVAEPKPPPPSQRPPGGPGGEPGGPGGPGGGPGGPGTPGGGSGAPQPSKDPPSQVDPQATWKEVTGETPNLCGCASGGSEALLALAVAGAALVGRRRRQSGVVS